MNLAALLLLCAGGGGPGELAVRADRGAGSVWHDGGRVVGPGHLRAAHQARLHHDGRCGAASPPLGTVSRGVVTGGPGRGTERQPGHTTLELGTRALGSHGGARAWWRWRVAMSREQATCLPTRPGARRRRRPVRRAQACCTPCSCPSCSPSSWAPCSTCPCTGECGDAGDARRQRHVAWGLAMLPLSPRRVCVPESGLVRQPAVGSVVSSVVRHVGELRPLCVLTRRPPVCASMCEQAGLQPHRRRAVQRLPRLRHPGEAAAAAAAGGGGSRQVGGSSAGDSASKGPCGWALCQGGSSSSSSSGRSRITGEPQN